MLPYQLTSYDAVCRFQCVDIKRAENNLQAHSNCRRRKLLDARCCSPPAGDCWNQFNTVCTRQTFNSALPCGCSIRIYWLFTLTGKQRRSIFDTISYITYKPMSTLEQQLYTWFYVPVKASCKMCSEPAFVSISDRNLKLGKL